MNDDIEKADRIVGIEHRMLCYTSNDPAQNTYRRGAYCEWLGTPERKKAAKLSLCDFSPLADIAAEVVRIDAEERRKKQPDDGLPPGPWEFNRHTISCGKDVRHHITVGLSDDRTMSGRDADAIVDHLCRASSPAVRRLLAAFDVTDGPTSSHSRALSMMDHVTVALVPELHVENTDLVFCWLTPRSTP